jgi:shikimate kinase
MKAGNPNIYLMGFMGCGKTKIGTLLARSLNRPFVDTDAVIVDETGLSINEIFERSGEKGFREIERDVVVRISRENSKVISLGGGSVILPENWDAISRSGITLTLSYPPEILVARLDRKRDRPILKDVAGNQRIELIRNMLSVREPLYRRADMVLHLNREIAPEAVTEMLLHYLKERE